MKHFAAFLCIPVLLVANCISAAETNVFHSDSKQTPVLYMIGDSTMANKPLFPAQPERGWGQLLPLYFKSDLRIENLAMNGRSSKSFRDEGRWQPVLDHLQPGDYVIIQFGHNDEKSEDPKRFQKHSARLSKTSRATSVKFEKRRAIRFGNSGCAAGLYEHDRTTGHTWRLPNGRPSGGNGTKRAAARFAENNRRSR